MDLNKLLKELDVCRIWESPEDEYMRYILDDINQWLENETDIQEWIEENLRGVDE